MTKKRLRLLCHNVRSLWNVGSFFRTCDAFGVEKIHLTGYTPTPPRKEIAKTALGAEETIPWEHHDDPADAVKVLQEDAWTVVALELLPESRDIMTYKAPDKLCVVVGHELSGVPKEVIDRCDAVLQVPMQGKKESLNVAVATGIALYHFRHSETE